MYWFVLPLGGHFLIFNKIFLEFFLRMIEILIVILKNS